MDDKAAPPEETHQIKSPEDQAAYDRQMKEHGEFVRVKNCVSTRLTEWWRLFLLSQQQISRRLKYVYDKENKSAASKDPAFAKLITLLTGTHRYCSR